MSGLDISVLNERLNITFDGFQNKTDKMLVYEAAPPASGASFTLTNSGAMTTNGSRSIGKCTCNKQRRLSGI